MQVQPNIRDIMNTYHLDRACKVMGSQIALATALGIRSASVYEWRHRGVPVDRCADIERVTGGQVTRCQLRPDHFGDLSAVDHAATVSTDGDAVSIQGSHA